MSRNVLNPLSCLLIVPLFAGCAPSLVDVLPDERLEINLPAASSVAKSTGDLPAEKDWSEFYLTTAEVTETVNGMVGVVLGMTNLIARTQRPSVYDSAEEYAEWGPYSDTLDPVETVLWIDHDAETDVYTWGYHQWPKEDDSQVYDVILGEVDPGATRQASTGRFTIDFTMLDRLDPTTNINGGTFAVDYDLAPDGVAGTVILTDIGEGALDADYAYTQIVDGEGSMDLTMAGDANPETGANVLETWSLRSRWTAEGVGRGDAKVTGGDLAADTATANECWDNAFEKVYRAESWSGLEEGDVSACAFVDASYVGD